ncbi:hypothetical protein JTB14_036570 [Gonioctena quinquepunctata]|nr:hypothetical protein JTB14_036570 [Gonioctena quinquepunctata]
MDFVENYLLDSDEDIDIVEVLQHERRLYIVRERVDNFEKWDDHDFHARFRMRKDTVLSILELIENSLEFRSDRQIFDILWRLLQCKQKFCFKNY